MGVRFETMFGQGGGPDPREMYRHAARRTAWPAKMGVLTAAVVGVLPLLLIVLAALVAGVAVYAVCRVLASVGDTVRGVFGGSGGGSPSADGGVSSEHDPVRENVRVMPRS